MNVSLNWAQENTDTDITSIGADEIVKKIGMQLGAVEDVTHWGPRYDGVIVARVMSCIKHPDADKLHICKIDDGGMQQNIERDEQGYVQVVCGAPNVREGLTVAWLPPGSTVPSTAGDAEPFVLSARELRGVVSNGMLASASELGISDNHEGLLEITAKDVGEALLRPGTLFKNLYGLDDVVIDCENKMFTHRPDCFGILGVAREIAGIQNKQFISPDWYMSTPTFSSVNDLPLEVRIETELSPRLMAVAVSGVTVGPSPIYMQAALTRVGIRPINNLVDITNWLMYLTGQPLHAYDYDKVKAVSGSVPLIAVRQSIEGEGLKLLNDKTITLKDDSSMVIATDNRPIGLAGIMGGSDTEVDATTKNIILEVASFDMYSVRKTAMKYGVFSDALTRFNKGQSPLQNDRVIAKALELVGQIAGGKQASNVFDVQPQSLGLESRKTSVSLSAVNTILGADFKAEEIARLLENVEFTYDGIESDDMMQFTVPFWRMDIALTSRDASLQAVANADIAEEVGRLYGYDKLPVALPRRLAKVTQKNQLLSLKSSLRQKLSAMGANELLTYSFVHGELLDKVGQNRNNAYQLGNALSPQLQYYRLSVTPSLLERVYSNTRAGYGSFTIFEIAKVHSKSEATDDGLPREAERLAVVVTANKKVAATAAGAAYYGAKQYLDELLLAYGVDATYIPFTQADEKYVSNDSAQPFLPVRAAVIMTKAGDCIGVIGEYTQTVLDSLKVPAYSAGFELDIETLLANSKQTSYVALPRFPKVAQDISLKVPHTVLYADLYDVLERSLHDKKPNNTFAQLAPLDIYQSIDDGSVKHISFRLSIASYDETLTADSINTLLDEIATDAATTYGAERL